MIPGFFDALAWPVPKVRVALFLPGITSDWKVVSFLLDTGAATTCVHPPDAIFALGIDPSRLMDRQAWPQQRELRGVGGSAVVFVVPAHYGFLVETGQWETFEAEIGIAELTATSQTLPSLLGWDVLQGFEVELNWLARTINLRKV